ncbi:MULTISPECIES: hypothetical protein [unclassified Tolypothrix]|nr:MULTISPECIES: hypothetical protein [unclassified Tolypothrix]UYD32714.1 hypothetical protein HG267_27470 [Tolypothrix sp. PCC 7601]
MRGNYQHPTPNPNYQLPITYYRLPMPNAQCPMPNSLTTSCCQCQWMA